MNMIEFRNVSKVYKDSTVALKNINLAIKKGEFVFLVGPSGSGKTTFIKLLIKEIGVTTGNIFVAERNICNLKVSRIPQLRRNIGYVFQDFKLLPKKTVFENVAFALEVAGEHQKRIDEIVPQVLKIVTLDQKHERYPGQLSGGEQQRVVIARSLVHRPKILVADEPTGNLDTINTHDIINLLKKINEFGTTVVLVKHNRDVENALKKRVVTLENGQIVSDKEEGKYVL